MGIEWARASDLPALAAFITEQNQTSSRRCMHSGTTLESNQKSLASLDPPLERSALVRRGGGRFHAAIVCDGDLARGNGYLLGPFVARGAEGARGDLLDAVIQRVRVPRLFAYSHVDNEANRRTYTSRGFVEGQPASIYRWQADAVLALPSFELTDALAPSEFESFAELHTRLFPGTYYSAEKIVTLAEPHRVFRVCEQGQVVGYVHAGDNDDPEAGYIHYLGVHEAWRRRGLGRRLMRTALDWLENGCGYRSVVLNLSSRHSQAKPLYESLGFRVEATGIGARLDRELARSRA